MPRATRRSSSVSVRVSASARPRVSCSAADLAGQEPDEQRQRHRPLLGSVMEVSLQPPALQGGALDDPGARARELVQLGERGCPQLLVLQGEPERRAECALEA